MRRYLLINGEYFADLTENILKKDYSIRFIRIKDTMFSGIKIKKFSFKCGGTTYRQIKVDLFSAGICFTEEGLI